MTDQEEYTQTVEQGLEREEISRAVRSLRAELDSIANMSNDRDWLDAFYTSMSRFTEVVRTPVTPKWKINCIDCGRYMGEHEGACKPVRRCGCMQETSESHPDANYPTNRSN